MTYFRILTSLFISLFIAACDTQQPPAPVDKTTEIKTAPQETVPEKPSPPLDLSIDNIPVVTQQNNDELFLKENEPTEENSALFNTLSKEQPESSTGISGKFFTDEAKLENKEYLDSIEGVQINIQGEFE